MENNLHLFSVAFLLSCAFANAQNEAPFKWETGAGAGLMPTFAKDRPPPIVPPLSL